MAGSFSVGALAIASPEANAVGAVRLTLLPRRVEVELLSGASYRESFVPGPLTQLSRFAVPYTAVRGFVRRAEGVVLSLDPLVAAPFNRFHLAHFTDLPLEALAAVHKRRAVLKALAQIVPVPLALALASWVPSSLASGALGRAAVGACALAASIVLLRALLRAVTFGGLGSERLLGAFERRLAERVGLRSAAIHETDPFDVPIADPEPTRRLAWSHAQAIRLVFAAGAVSLGVGGLALFGWLRALPKPPAAPEARAGLQVFSLRAASALAPSPPGPPCSCDRTDSPLWRDGLPVLSVIPIPRRRSTGAPVVAAASGGITPERDAQGVSRYDFDVAIVNNASEDLADLRLVLTFARRDERGERIGVTDRGLFWEGALRPGRSVKWNVRAPGTELRIDVDEVRMLAGSKGNQGALPAAPAGAWKKLLSAQKPAVRLHAAMMLAWLGDPDAGRAATELSGLTVAEEEVRQRILRAASPLRVCDVQTGLDGSLQVCAFNGGETAVDTPEISELGPDDAGRRVSIDEPIGAGEGLRCKFPRFGEPAEELALRARSR